MSTGPHTLIQFSFSWPAVYLPFGTLFHIKSFSISPQNHNHQSNFVQVKQTSYIQLKEAVRDILHLLKYFGAVACLK